MQIRQEECGIRLICVASVKRRLQQLAAGEGDGVAMEYRQCRRTHDRRFSRSARLGLHTGERENINEENHV
jgi:hypothetical protein